MNFDRLEPLRPSPFKTKSVILPRSMFKNYPADLIDLCEQMHGSAVQFEQGAIFDLIIPLGSEHRRDVLELDFIYGMTDGYEGLIDRTSYIHSISPRLSRYIAIAECLGGDMVLCNCDNDHIEFWEHEGLSDDTTFVAANFENWIDLLRPSPDEIGEISTSGIDLSRSWLNF